MIVGQHTDCIEKTLGLIRESEFTFQLTGSRFFGMKTRDSDWDFFVQASDEVQEWLLEHDFAPDSHCADYWQALQMGGAAQFNLYVDKSNKIHVQLVQDFHHKQAIQTALKSWNHFINCHDKKQRCLYWQLA